MKYTQIQRRTTEEFITIEDYIQQSQPNIFKKLYKELKPYIKDVTEAILAAADVYGADKQYERIMQERPYPGRGGLLPGEKEEYL